MKPFMQKIIDRIWRFLFIRNIDLNKIIFEYGAYMLRKNYPWYLMTALGLAGSLFLYACLLPAWSEWLGKAETMHSSTPNEIMISKKKPNMESIAPQTHVYFSSDDISRIREIILRDPYIQ